MAIIKKQFVDGRKISKFQADKLKTQVKNAHNVKQHLLLWKSNLSPTPHILDAIKPSLVVEKRDFLLVEPNSQGERGVLLQQFAISLVFPISSQMLLENGDGCLKTLFAKYQSL